MSAGDCPRWPMRSTRRTSPRRRRDVTDALDRLAFDELLALQLTLAQVRQARESLVAPRVAVTEAERREIVDALPFTLTDDQASAVEAIVGGPRLRAADAPAAPGRRGQRQDRGGGRGAGVRRASGLAGGAHGADRDPRPPAPRRPRAAARRARRAGRVPVGLAGGGAQARDPRRDRAAAWRRSSSARTR